MVNEDVEQIHFQFQTTEDIRLVHYASKQRTHKMQKKKETKIFKMKENLCATVVRLVLLRHRCTSPQQALLQIQ